MRLRWSLRRFHCLAASPAALEVPRAPLASGTSSRTQWPSALVVAGGAAAAFLLRQQWASQCQGPPLKLDESLVISADCGGTTTRLRLYRVPVAAPVVEKQEAPGVLICEEKFPNIMFKSLGDIMELFLDTHCGQTRPRPTVAVLAVAGIVTSNQCRFTNLDWVVDGNEMAKRLGIARVEIINDFVAQGYGTLTLGDDDLLPLNSATPRRGAPIGCIGAGTGLGQCFLTADPSGDYRCYPSEGGHAEFAPRGEGSDEEQIELLKYLKVKFSGWNRISVERVVSGKGICNIYEFMAYQYPRRVDRKMHQEFLAKQGDASVIARHATPGSLCSEVLDIFSECYGAQCGSLAITLMPFRGLFITGGVSKKLAHMLQDENGGFMRAYRDKGRVSPLLEQVPIYLVKSDDMGQRGAHLRSVRLLQEHLIGQEGRIDETATLEEMVLVPPRDVLDPSAGVDTGDVALSDIVSDFRARGRRMIIGEEEKAGNEPVFQSMLWRVIRVGTPTNPDDWVNRQMWISKDGNLVYTRLSSNDNEVYFTNEDLKQASIEPINDDASCRPWSFKVDVPGFQPAYFAAATSAGRDFWVEELRALRSSRA